MIFKVCRTSVGGQFACMDENSMYICDEAVGRLMPCYDVRLCTEEFYDENIAKHGGDVKWRDRGSEHRILPSGGGFPGVLGRVFVGRSSWRICRLCGSSRRSMAL